MKSNIYFGLIAVLLFACYTEYCEASKDIAWKWGTEARRTCKQLAKGKEAELKKGICEMFQEVVEDSFDIMGMNMANVVGGATTDELYKRSEQPPWNFAMRGMIESTAEWVVESKVKKMETIKQEWEKNFMGWMLKLATGDSSSVGPMPKFRPGEKDEF